ncbi:MAG: hypothetical protein ACYC8T_35710 [Myxococcaceae bacterium]
MSSLPLALLALLTAAPDAGKAEVEGPLAPLGRVGDVIEEPRQGGYPANEQVLVTTFEGCPREQAVNLSRFVSGVAEAGAQLQAWLEGKGPKAPRGVEQKLFKGKKRLLEAVRRAWQSTPVQGLACPLPLLADGWKLGVDKAPKPCPLDAGTGPQPLHLFGLVGKGAAPLTAVVSVLPSPEGRADRCRPRLSAVLFDDGGRARLRYHADYGGGLEVTVVGDSCQELDLTLDPGTQRFTPVVRKACSPALR